YLTTEFFPRASQPVDVLGTSIGAWRLLNYTQADPVAAMERFRHFYFSQHYAAKPSREDVTAEAGRLLSGMLGESGAREIAENPRFRLHVIAARGKGGAASEDRARLLGAMGMLALGNIVTPDAPFWWFERVMFRHRKGDFPWHDSLPLAATAEFTAENVFPALLATGSIPLVLNGIRDIPGAPEGVYRDGGLTDYHLAVPLAPRDGIVLYPHFSPRVVPGWFDKALRWRVPDATHFDDVLLVAPSRDFIATLPYGRIPDRNDFVRLTPDERVRYWREVLEATRRMVDEFHDLVSTDRWRAALRPLSFGSGGTVAH
ncbi:MAG TPA: hypothetical protein VFM34_03895, partial [Moraxellaceae bacterium]|nr:hypothetical protein [Moraxellaceae bacterium]